MSADMRNIVTKYNISETQIQNIVEIRYIVETAF